uniref:Uncharacterized protein n=1 Tax=Anguilla anguilla TaxID=7936 RepID=A0A0E9ULA6_ANGAN
MDEFQCPEP